MTNHHDLRALVHPPVLSGDALVIYVARRQDGTFLVGGPDFTEDAPSEFIEVSFEDLLEVDSSLSDLDTLTPGHCASRANEWDEWAFGVVPVGSMFLVMCDARPSESHPERDDLGGAIVNCWLVAESVDQAEAEAHQHIVESEWVIIDILRAQDVDDDEFEENEYVRQASVDGLVAVFHTYPKDPLALN